MTLARPLWLVSSLTCLLFASCSPRSSAKHDYPEGTIVIRGAGSTFAAPLYQEWIKKYLIVKPDQRVEYDAVGSGEGQARFLAGSVDFGASDAILNAEQIAKVERGVVMVPIAAGSIVLAYNLEGVEGLKLPRDVYVDIFLGKIKSWDDPRIVDANPGLKLPKFAIFRIVRLDSSGTTHAFTSHLCAVSDEWRNGPGAGKLVAWPGAHQTMPGNERVAGVIKQSTGAIGYVEYGTARTAGLKMATLQNKQGEYVVPSVQASQVAIAGVGTDIQQLATMHDSDAKGAYPIVSCTWLFAYKKYGEPKQATAVRDFIRWSLTAGQESCDSVGFVRLAAEIETAALKSTEQIGS